MLKMLLLASSLLLLSSDTGQPKDNDDEISIQFLEILLRECYQTDRNCNSLLEHEKVNTNVWRIRAMQCVETWINTEN